MVGTAYSTAFYDDHRDGSDRSARVLVPLIMELLAPQSVVDVGCGVGLWCRAFADQGVPLVTGIDGPWVTETAQWDRVSLDFNTAPLPFRPALPAQKYDLAITLEFIEHILPERAEATVDLLTSLSDVVLAGGAIPGQGGAFHVNEQWPHYWHKLFADRGFAPYDLIRPLAWDLPGVMPWYAQNTIGYFKHGVPPAVKARVEQAALARLRAPAALVHPGMFAHALDPTSRPLAWHLDVLARFLRWRLAGRPAHPFRSRPRNAS